jgi:hypothetical protein
MCNVQIIIAHNKQTLLTKISPKNMDNKNIHQQTKIEKKHFAS